MNYYIGVDPGKNGGYCVITVNGSVTTYSAQAWDDQAFITSMSRVDPKRTVAYVEKVAAMPKQGVVSTFTFGKGAGFIEGVLAAFGIPYQLVPPRVWKKEYSLDSDKKHSIEAAKKLFPGVSLFKTPRCTSEHDGIAEACLIAEYAKRAYTRS